MHVACISCLICVYATFKRSSKSYACRIHLLHISFEHTQHLQRAVSSMRVACITYLSCTQHISSNIPYECRRNFEHVQNCHKKPQQPTSGTKCTKCLKSCVCSVDLMLKRQFFYRTSLQSHSVTRPWIPYLSLSTDTKIIKIHGEMTDWGLGEKGWGLLLLIISCQELHTLFFGFNFESKKKMQKS